MPATEAAGVVVAGEKEEPRGIGEAEAALSEAAGEEGREVPSGTRPAPATH